jgi:hypothetical protein
MTVTLTIDDRTETHPDALAAIRALLRLLPNEQLGGMLWQDLIRNEKLRRTDGIVGPRGAAGTNVVTSVR